MCEKQSISVTTRTNPPRVAKHPSPSSTPHGQPTTPTTARQPRADPSPSLTPRPIKKAPPNLGVITGVSPRPKGHSDAPTSEPLAPAIHTGQLDTQAIMMAIKAAMMPFMTHLSALEQTSMPPPPDTTAPKPNKSGP